MSQKSVQGWLYLIHFREPYHHAQHYLGFAEGRLANVQARFDRHCRGTGARLCQVVATHGIELQLVATWRGTKSEERALKRRSRLAAHCPVCQFELLVNGQPKRRI